MKEKWKKVQTSANESVTVPVDAGIDGQVAEISAENRKQPVARNP